MTFELGSAVSAIAPVVGSAQHAVALDGRGVTVAVIDSGIDASRYEGALVTGPDFTVAGPRRDATGHGTHLGAIVGDAHVGVAPGATVIDVRVAGEAGATDVNAVIQAIDWVVAHRHAHAIGVLLLAFGVDRLPGGTFDPLAAAVDRAWHAGIVVVVAAGNQGADAPMQTPAISRTVLTIGAAEHVDGAWAPCDFSTRGDGIVDLYAPGRSIVSVLAAGSAGEDAPETSKVGTSHVKGSGSSQAAAVVAGAAAILLQVDPTLTPDAVRAVLAASATAHGDDFPGVLDLDIAIASLAIRQPVAPRIVDLVPAGWTWGGLEWSGWTWGGWTWGGLEWSGWTWGGWTWGGQEWAGWTWGGWTWGGQEWAGWTWGGWTWGGQEWAGWTWGGWTWGGQEWAGWTWGGWTWGGLEWA